MESIWTDVSLPAYRPLSGEIKTDVLIIGGGMAGLLCARLLTDAGIDCVVAEAGRIAGGITKNTTAKITSQHGLIYGKLISRFDQDTAWLYLQANEAAVADYRKLCRSIDCDYSRQDHFIFSRCGREALEQELSALQSLGFGAEFTEDLPLPFPTVGAVTFPDQGQFHPLKFLRGILPGLTVFERTPVRHLTKLGAITDYGRIQAQQTVVCTHFPFLNKHGSYFMKLYQQRSYALSLSGAPALSGMYLEDRENGLSLRSHAGQLILGGGGHRTGKTGSGWTALEKTAHRYYPHTEIIHRWATQDCMSLDGLPYIGRYSARTEDLYVATGFNKWGMTSSMVAARVLRDLILGKQSPYTDLFSPSRSMLHPQLGINMLESAKNLLTPTSPRCPHLGCALKWNAQERSWDCPCHGSRFEEAGKLIDNPASGDLKRQK